MQWKGRESPSPSDAEDEEDLEVDDDGEFNTAVV
jgi:hypothetical protein